MEFEYKTYCFYSHMDSNAESLGICEAGTIGIATIHFASTKRMEIKDFLKIYSVKEKDESK